MSLFVDASAIVAIIGSEADRAELERRLAESTTNLWSAMTAWESVAALVHSYRHPVAAARSKVEGVAEVLSLKMVSIDERVSAVALSAYETYGKGSGHRARLNMGDCFAYACAKTSGAVLLYKGDDFARTDLA